jgi:hypothetical protein
MGKSSFFILPCPPILSMNSKIAGALSIFGGLGFLGIWLILLLVANPDCLTSYEAAKETLLFTLTAENSWFFISTLFSMLSCTICGALLLSNKFQQQIMYIIAAHTLIALFVYDWSLVFVISLPLIYFMLMHKKLNQ